MNSIAFMRFPPMPEIPEPLQGQFVVWLRVAYAGDAESVLDFSAVNSLAARLRTTHALLTPTGSLPL